MKLFFPRLLFLIFGLVSTHSLAQANTLPKPPPVDPELSRLPISSMLYNLEGYLADFPRTGSQFVHLVRDKGFQGTELGLVNVEIVNQVGNDPVDKSLLKKFGGEIDGVWRGQTSAWLPPEQAIPLARNLPSGFYLRQAHLAVDNDEGPATIGSDTYINPGPAGAGMIVGIIDRNFAGLIDARLAGAAPYEVIEHNYNEGGFEDGTWPHGTAQTETVFDHVPLAEFHLFRIGNSTHLGLAVDDAIAVGVNVLSATQSFYNEGWEDNSGTATQAVNHAASNGILYVTSAGNRGETHWQGIFNDSDGDDWHNWSGNDNNNGLGFGIVHEDKVDLYLQWDRQAGVANYDLHLINANNGTVLASSTSGGEAYEEIHWENETNQVINVDAAVFRISGAAVEFEMFEIHSRPFQHQVPESSLTSPNNSSAANCLVLGAVPFSNYADGQLYGYSSRGPTNSGYRGIDLVGPTNTTTFAYGGAFGGTSCSTPNTAGAIAALWSSNQDLSAEGIRGLVTHLAELYNDWGEPGPDPQYGYGGVRLPAFQDLTFWVDRSVGNITNIPGFPWYYLDDAMAGTVDYSRLLFLGGEYPEAVTITEPRILQSVVGDAILGDHQ